VREGSVCAKSGPIDIAHYTPVNGVPRLHGHTFRIVLCVSGPIREGGMVVDFGILDRFLRKIEQELNFSLLAPYNDRELIESWARHAPFEIKAIYLPGPATAEILGLWICKKLRQELTDLSEKMRLYVIIDEGIGHRATVQCLPKISKADRSP
jgi:6-pyruvoyl-tetrahydropterin synthase